MRKTCLDCVRKHLAQALVLLDEAQLGYPHHRWLAVGHLAEAESEALQEYPELAREIRKCRLIVMQSHASSAQHCVEDLIRLACIIAGEDDLVRFEDPNNSKKFSLPVALAA